jgi:hypothetical protein
LPTDGSLTTEEEKSKLNYEFEQAQKALIVAENLVLQAKAFRLGVEVPHDKSQFRQTYPDIPLPLLNTLGLSHLKKKVNDELWNRRERWIRLIGALTGLAGTIIGIIAIAKK